MSRKFNLNTVGIIVKNDNVQAHEITGSFSIKGEEQPIHFYNVSGDTVEDLLERYLRSQVSLFAKSMFSKDDDSHDWLKQYKLIMAGIKIPILSEKEIFTIWSQEISGGLPVTKEVKI